jgi:hypothetical protein
MQYVITGLIVVGAVVAVISISAAIVRYRWVEKVFFVFMWLLVAALSVLAIYCLHCAIWGG